MMSRDQSPLAGILWRYAVFALLVLLSVACSEQPALNVSLSDGLLAGDVHPPVTTTAAAWSMGFDRRLEPKEDVRQIASLTNWLQAETGLQIEPYVTPRGGSVVADLCSETIDFAVVGTVSYLQANQRCGAQILVRGLNSEGADSYRAAIVVAADSPIETLADLQNHSFAFGAPNSTQGHLIPRLMLQQSGLSLDDLGAYSFHESHVAAANAVTSGRFDAAGLQDTLAHDLAERGLVRIVVLSEPYPSSGIIAAPNVPRDTLQRLQDALVSLTPAEIGTGVLYHWERTEMPGGYVVAQDADYDNLRQIAGEVGLLEQ